MNLGKLIVDTLFALLGILPKYPSEVTSVIDGAFAFLFSGINLVGIFVDLNMVKILIPLVIAILNMDKIIKFIVFAVKKIPFIGIE